MLTVASTGTFSMRDLLPRQETESLPLPRGDAAANRARAQTTATGIVTRWALSYRLRVLLADAAVARGKGGTLRHLKRSP